MLERVTYNYAIIVGHGTMQKTLKCRKLNITGQDRCAKKTAFYNSESISPMYMNFLWT